MPSLLKILPQLLEKRSQRRSLRFLLIVPFVLQIFGTVGLVGYLSFRSGQQAVNDLASQLRGELTARIQQQLQTYVEVPFLINQINATSLARGNLKIAQVQGEYLLWQQAKTFPTTNLIYCGSEADGTFMGVGRSSRAKNLTLNLQFSNPSTNYRFHYYGLDNNGNPTKINRTDTKRYDPRVRPWYQAAIAKRAPTWSKIYIDFDAQIPVVTASVPVYDPANQKLLGVCATDFLLSVELDTFLSKLQVGKSGETFIIERSGALVSSSTSSEEELLVGTGDTTKRRQATDSQNPLVRATARYLRDQFQGDLNQIQHEKQLDFLLNHRRQFLQVVPFKDARGLDWLIVVVIPEADFMGQINANTRFTILWCIAALGLAIAIGILTARWVTRPILRLNSAAKEIAQGHLDTTVDVTQQDEIGELAHSFNQMGQQLKASFVALEDANKDLENRVEARTAELKTANDEISLLNGRLKQENLRMSAELDVARRLQQMILPNADELAQIPELDIAGFMEVAAEVGGDYYDVIRHDGRVTIGIGDVTGHGLQSGVLMIMAQTAVRALLAVKEPDPAKFLNAINQVIHQNAQRMSPGKNLTLALLDYQDGSLSLSGQHEEVLVVRSGGQVERFDTTELGFPLGMVDDIASFVVQAQIPLNPGDGVVLYTDGVTEAENTRRDLYGIERLIEVIGQNWQRSALEINQAVIEDVRRHVDQHTIYDDITLVVLKRK
jgi:phosphoserine phosphatase RsbU/P